MKKILTILIALLTLTACTNDEPIYTPMKRGKLQPPFDVYSKTINYTIKNK